MRLNVPVPSRAAISDLEVSKGGKQPLNRESRFLRIHTIPSINVFPKTDETTGPGAANEPPARLAHSDEIKNRFQEIIELRPCEGRLNTTISAEVSGSVWITKKWPCRVLDPDRRLPTRSQALPDDLLHYREPRTHNRARECATTGISGLVFRFRGNILLADICVETEVPRFTQVANAVPPLVAKQSAKCWLSCRCSLASGTLA